MQMTIHDDPAVRRRRREQGRNIINEWARNIRTGVGQMLELLGIPAWVGLKRDYRLALDHWVSLSADWWPDLTVWEQQAARLIVDDRPMCYLREQTEKILEQLSRKVAVKSIFAALHVRSAKDITPVHLRRLIAFRHAHRAAGVPLEYIFPPVEAWRASSKDKHWLELRDQTRKIQKQCREFGITWDAALDEVKAKKWRDLNPVQITALEWRLRLLRRQYQWPAWLLIPDPLGAWLTAALECSRNHRLMQKAMLSRCEMPPLPQLGYEHVPQIQQRLQRMKAILHKRREYQYGPSEEHPNNP